MPKVSIICCSFQRTESLKRLRDSLDRQTFRDFEFILCDEEAPLVELKDKGWKKSKGEILVWVDDDVEMGPHWLENLVWFFEHNPQSVGYTNRTIVPEEYSKNRDIFKYRWLHKLYNWLFVDGKLYEPGYISKCGVNSIGGNFTNKAVWNVDFLEPPCFALHRWVVETINGFDLGFKGVAEWCDVDLCFKIKRYGMLFYDGFSPIYHYPIKDKTTSKRLDTKSRYENYCRWADRWGYKGFKNRLYRLFLRIYFLSVELMN